MESNIVGDLFLECLHYWQSVKSTQPFNKLINDGISQYVELYHKCSCGSAKYAELFLHWLDYTRQATCENIEVATVDVSPETKRTVLAVTLKSLYDCMQQEMARGVEKVSASSGSASCSTKVHSL